MRTRRDDGCYGSCLPACRRNATRAIGSWRSGAAATWAVGAVWEGMRSAWVSGSAKETGDFVMRSVPALAELSRRGRASWGRLALAVTGLHERGLLTPA